MNIENTIVDILGELCPGVDCNANTELVDSRILDSLTMVAFVADLEDAFEIEIPPVEVVADNFNSVAAIGALITRLVQEGID